MRGGDGILARDEWQERAEHDPKGEMNARGDDGDSLGRTPAGDEWRGEDLQKVCDERHRGEDADFGLGQDVGFGDEGGDEDVYRERHRDQRHGHEAVDRAQAEAAGEVGFTLVGGGARGDCVHVGLARNQRAWPG